MKNILAALFFLGIAFVPQQLFACGKHKVHSVRMERTQCFGKCPAYIIEVNEDGLVKYWGKSNAPRQGYYEARIDKNMAKDILNRFTKKKVRNAQDEYRANIADVPMLHYTFKVGNYNDIKSVRQANFGPPYLVANAEYIDTVLANVQWVRASDNENE